MSQVRPSPQVRSLSRACIGERRQVATVNPEHADELAREGVLTGVVVEVVGRAPLGGPVIVTVGRVRLALSGEVAASIETEAIP